MSSPSNVPGDILSGQLEALARDHHHPIDVNDIVSVIVWFTQNSHPSGFTDALEGRVYDPTVLEEQVVVRRLDLEKKFPFPVAVGSEHEFTVGVTAAWVFPRKSLNASASLELGDRHLASRKESETPAEVLPQADVLGVLVVKGVCLTLIARPYLECRPPDLGLILRGTASDDAAEPPTHDDGLPVRLLELEDVVNVWMSVELRVGTLGRQVRPDIEVDEGRRVHRYWRVLREVVLVEGVGHHPCDAHVHVVPRGGHQLYLGFAPHSSGLQAVDAHFRFQPADVRLPYVPESVDRQLPFTNGTGSLLHALDVRVQFCEQ